MESLTFEDFTKPEDILQHTVEAEKAGISIKHDGMAFKKVLLEMALKCSKKSLFSNIDLASINRPASISSESTQLETIIKPLSVVISYIHEMNKTDDCVQRLKLLLSSMVCYMGETLLLMTEKIPLLPLLGETLKVIL